jgi:hypothetical protein
MYRKLAMAAVVSFVFISSASVAVAAEKKSASGDCPNSACDFGQWCKFKLGYACSFSVLPGGMPNECTDKRCGAVE